MDRSIESRLASLLVFCPSQINADDNSLLDAVTLYASFDREIKADFGGGSLVPRTRMDDETEPKQHVVERVVDPKVFGIASGKGVAGGALECRDVLPRRGRIFIPAAGNLAFDPEGWGGAVSMWLNTDPNRLLKTPFCDPIQITAKRAHDGAIWVDFPKGRPRALRMGVFPALAPAEKPVKESDPRAPIVRLPRVPFRSGKWHHVALSWKQFDSGRANAEARLYVDGQLIGQLTDREIAMKWDIRQTPCHSLQSGNRATRHAALQH